MIGDIKLSPKCDWENCDKEAKYKIANLNINLCKGHFAKSNEEPKVLFVKGSNPLKLSFTEANIIYTLQQNGIQLPVSRLLSALSMSEDFFCQTLEGLIKKQIVKIE